MRKTEHILAILMLQSALGCATTRPSHPAAALAENFAELSKFVNQDRLQLKEFGRHGPFAFDTQSDFAVRLSADQELNSDLFISHARGKSPLVILAHGNGSDKADHRKQAEHLASWGMHTMLLQLPNQGQWLENGAAIKRLVDMLHAWPALINNRVDLHRIILAGHSFGGSAVSLAAAYGARVQGIVLLDPAVYDQQVETHLRKNKKPIILIGADPSVFKSKRRQNFRRNTAGPIAEVSVRGATHNDAQYPDRASWAHLVLDPFTSEAKQQIFLAALTTSALSLAGTGKIDHAWNVLTAAVEQDILADPIRK